jgi:SAM-dependent methyltransferase
MRRQIASLLRRSGLMPLVFQTRMRLAPVMPGTLANNLRWWLGGARESLPLPSARARFLVAGSADIQGFLELGRRAADSIEAAVAKAGRPIGGMSAILDFGCGSGRVLRHWQKLEDLVDVHGTEMNPLLVAECARCVPFATVAMNGPAPPLGYPDARFDLIYALSVFTHLHEDLQRAWRDELRRLLRPGGLLLVTTHGRSYAPRLAADERARFERGECVVQGAEFLGENLCIAYHPEASVRALFATGFEIADFLPEGARGNPSQDLWVLRKR